MAKSKKQVILPPNEVRAEPKKANFIVFGDHVIAFREHDSGGFELVTLAGSFFTEPKKYQACDFRLIKQIEAYREEWTIPQE